MRRTYRAIQRNGRSQQHEENSARTGCDNGRGFGPPSQAKNESGEAPYPKAETEGQGSGWVVMYISPFRFVLIAVAGWMNQHQLQMIDYLREENRVLREQLGGRRVRLKRRPAPAISCQGERTRTKAASRGRNHCDARDVVGLASETDRPEIRRQSQARTGATSHRRSDRGFSGWNGRMAQGLGLKEHPGHIV